MDQATINIMGNQGARERGSQAHQARSRPHGNGKISSRREGDKALSP